jgi:phage-related protein
MAGAANVLIKIGANAGDAITEIGKVNKALGDQMTGSQKASMAIRKAAVPAGLALAALGAAAISCAKAAAEDEAAQVKLAGVLQRTAGASDAAVRSTEDYIEKLSLATGVADDQLRPAMAKLATATGSVTEAQQGLAVALDISAATGKSVDQVSKALAKAYAGNGSALAKLIPGINEAAVKSGDFATINKELARLTGGAAAEAANTAAGQYKIFQLTLQETQEEIGMALLPVLKQLAPVLVNVATFVKENTDLIVKLGAVVGALAATVVGVNAAMTAYQAISSIVKVATTAWTVAQVALNFALTANPIGIVVVAIAALVAGLILAYRNSETFRNIVDQVFAAVKRTTEQALRPFIDNWDEISRVIDITIGYLRRFWPLLLPGGLFWLALKEAQDRFGALTIAIDVAKVLLGSIKTTTESYITILGILAAGVVLVTTRIKTSIETALNPFKSALDTIITTVEKLINLLGRIKVPSINIPGFGTPSGAAKRLDANAFVTPTSQTNVNVTINGPIDADSTARELLAILQQYDTRYAIA